MSFDLEKKKVFLLSDLGSKRAIARLIGSGRQANGLGNSAGSFVTLGIYCLLAGIDENAQELFEKAHTWLTEAIEQQEVPMHYGQDGTEALRYETMALCEWLRADHYDTESLQKYIEHKDRYLNREGYDKQEVSLALASYLHAGAYGRVIEIFEKTLGLSAPTSLKTIRGEAPMAYSIAQSRLGEGCSAEILEDAGSRFLSKNVDTWLNRGHATRAAEWIRIIYDPDYECHLPAKNLVMRCLDHLPVTRK